MYHIVYSYPFWIENHPQCTLKCCCPLLDLQPLDPGLVDNLDGWWSSECPTLFLLLLRILLALEIQHWTPRRQSEGHQHQPGWILGHRDSMNLSIKMKRIMCTFIKLKEIPSYKMPYCSLAYSSKFRKYCQILFLCKYSCSEQSPPEL